MSSHILQAMTSWQAHAIRLITQNAVYYNPAMVKHVRTSLVDETGALAYKEAMTRFMQKYESNTTTHSTTNQDRNLTTPTSSRELALLLYSIKELPTGVITTSDGTDIVPAVVTFNGGFTVGTYIDIQGSTDGVQPNWGLQITLEQDYQTVEAFAMAAAEFLSGNDGITFIANGATVEVLGILGTTMVTVDVLTVTPSTPTGTITTAAGTDVVPAVATFSGHFDANTKIDIGGTTNGVQPNWGLNFVLSREYLTVEDFVEAAAEFLSGNDGMTFVANGADLEILGILGTTAVTLDTLVVTPS